MPYGMYISAAGAEAQSRRLEVLSHNLANVDTPGFKRELAITQARHSEAIEQGEDHPGSRSLNDIGGGVLVRETVTDFSRGALKSTGTDTDMAIDGEGFFVVEKDGQQFLTRSGNFTLGPEGQLKTQQGFSVLSSDNAPILIDVSLGDFKVNKNGSISQGADSIELALVKPQSLGDLVRVGENLFTPLAPTTPLETEERSVRGGHLEQSTVNPTLEMMDLIESSRAYEANIKLIQNQDHMIGQLVSRLLRQS